MTSSNQFKVHGQLPLYGLTVCDHGVGVVTGVSQMSGQWFACAFAGHRKRGRVGSPAFIYPLWSAPVGGGGSQVHTVHMSNETSVGLSQHLWRKLGIQMVSVQCHRWDRISLIVSLFPSSCLAEMERWLEDIRMAIDLAEQSTSPNTDLLSTGLPGNSMPPLLQHRAFPIRPFPPFLFPFPSELSRLHNFLFYIFVKSQVSVIACIFPMVLRAVGGRWGWAGVGGWTRQLALLPGAAGSPRQHHCARLLASQHQCVNGGLQCCCGGIKHLFSHCWSL